jgi:hypothetical protein
MRNVWNDTEVRLLPAPIGIREGIEETDVKIPEAYFDKVVAYLKTLPGMARKVNHFSLMVGLES